MYEIIFLVDGKPQYRNTNEPEQAAKIISVLKQYNIKFNAWHNMKKLSV